MSSSHRYKDVATITILMKKTATLLLEAALIIRDVTMIIDPYYQ